MAKKIFLFADGTGNAYSTQESNVWRLYQALDTSSNDVVAKYIPGVCTSSFKPWATFDAATGIGVPTNVRELYGFLCDEFAAGAGIYMFGFSRGAFTIRTLIGLIASQGLVTRKQDGLGGLVEVASTEMDKYTLAAWQNYRAEVADSWPWWQSPPLVHVVRTIRKLRQFFYRSRYERPRVQKVTIKFVGLFDTVEAFGVPIEEMRAAIDRVFWPISFRNGKMSAIAENVQHALSLDDERTSFHPLRIEPADKEDLAGGPQAHQGGLVCRRPFGRRRRLPGRQSVLGAADVDGEGIAGS